MFRLETKVKLHDTDAAGILFFANYFKLAHDAYEEFMISAGFGFDKIINESDFLLLIAHAEADYKKPLSLSERLEIVVYTERITDSSFVLGYRLADSDGHECATVRSVHVAVNKETGAKIALPPLLRQALAEHQS